MIDLGHDTLVTVSSMQVTNLQADAREALQAAKNIDIRSFKAQITSERETALGPYPGIQFEAEGEKFHVRSQV